MRPTYTIEDIFETLTRARMLRTLATASSPQSIRSLGAGARLSHTGAAAVLRDLESMGLVQVVHQGRARLYSLLFENTYVRHMLLPAVRGEARVVEELREDLVSTFGPDSVSLILFGSYAYQGQDESSDIDVLAVAADELRRRRLADLAVEHGSRFYRAYGSTLSLLAYTRPQAREAREGKTGFISCLDIDGMLLHGLWVTEWGSDEPQDRDEAGGGLGGAATPEEGSRVARWFEGGAG